MTVKETILTLGCAFGGAAYISALCVARALHSTPQI